MPPKAKPVLEDSPENNDDHAQESSTAILLEWLIDHITKHDDTLALLTELLGKQQKQSLSKDTYTPQGIPLPKASDIPHFLGPLSDADKVLTHLRHLQQVLHLHGLLMQLDDADMEERQWGTVIELANNSVECAGMIGWVEQDSRHMEKDGSTTWEEWSAAFKAKAMPSNWEFCEAHTLFCLSFHETSSESWRKFDNAPRINQLDTELTAGDAMSAYLALAQMIPSDIADGQDHLHALFHPLLAISVPAPANDQLPAHPIQFLLDTRASTTFVDLKLAVKLGWSVQTGAIQMKVCLAGGKHGLLADANSFVHLLEAGGANLSALGLQKEGAPKSKIAPATLHNTEIHSTTLQAAMAAGSDSLADVLCHLQAKFHDVFCDDLGDVRNFPTISKTKSGIRFEINLKQGATLHHSPPYRIPEALLLISMRCY
ncbi:hypothetical protein D1P53_004953 [Cryptococcus gattii VGV]|nr:hypothetical protein D1P53_004953 [Cryptococcus gattii VGV]